MNTLQILAITRDTQYDLLVSRVPCIGENILIGDFNYKVKHVQHLPNGSQKVAHVWVVESPQPTRSISG